MSVVRATAVVVAHNGGDELGRCVRALLAAGYGAVRVLVVDNGSSDGACERVEASGLEAVQVLRTLRNLGFAGGVNAGLSWLETDLGVDADHVVILVNQDCLVRQGAVAALVTRLSSDPRIGVVGARILAPDGRTVQHAGGIIRENGLTQHVGRGLPDGPPFWNALDVEYVTGALCAFRKSTWDELGPLDERYSPVYFEEVDFCLRARNAGLRVVYEPACVGIHAEATASGGVLSPLFLRRYHRNRIRFLAHHRLRRGSVLRTVSAEVRWITAQRRVADVWPAVRAYVHLPADMAQAHRARRIASG